MIVLDASVVLKWFFKDEYSSEKAMRYKERHISGAEIIAVPDLIFYEIANVFTTKTSLGVKDVSEVFSLIWQFGFEIFSLGLDEFLSGIALSKKYGITFYDASYIELARKLNCNFITTDRKLYEKAREMKEVRLL